MTRFSCHCGTIEIDVTLKYGPENFRRCDCSYCRRRGAIMGSVALADLQIVKGEENLSRYQFGTNTAQHFFCKTCGIYTHHQRRSEPTEYGVNVACLEGINPRDLGQIAWADGVHHPSDRKV